MEEKQPSFFQTAEKRMQVFLDSTAPYHQARWGVTAVLLFLYFVRVFVLGAFYIYALGIYLLNLFLAFLQPKFDPAMEEESLDEGALPTRSTDEFKPFIRRLPEFKFWYWASRGIFTALFATLFPFFDVPVFWPILVVYFLVLFALTMKQRIRHMIKYNYVPWNFGKKNYASATSKS